MKNENITIDKAAIVGARRTIIRIFRNQYPTFTYYDLKIQVQVWSYAFLGFHFLRAPHCRDRWMASEVFHQWALDQYELRNVELLLQLGYDIHHHGRMTKEEYACFIQQYLAKHREAMTKIYPPKPIIQQISNQTNS